MEKCILCNNNIAEREDVVKLQQKGADSINKASELRGDAVEAHSGLIVHKACRLNYTNTKNIDIIKRQKEKAATEIKRVLRSDSTFSFKTDCVFCGKSTESKQFHDKTDVIKVRTFDFKKSIQTVCKERNDSWSHTLEARIEYAQDLHASDTVYHRQCSTNFRTFKQIPTVHKNIKDDLDLNPSKRGRPSVTDRESAFFNVTRYLEENDEEQITINDLIAKMKDYLEDTDIEPFSFKHMKRRLIDHFKDRIIITELAGKSNVVTFRSTASIILHQFYNSPKNEDSESEKYRLIETAAKLIKNDTKLMRTDSSVYPSSEEISSVDENLARLPGTLKVLLENIFVGKDTSLKVASIGQAIIQSIRPRILNSPLQIGLGVQMHRQFGSRFLIDTLNQLGFCSSYSEVQKYERSAAVHIGTDIPGLMPDMFVQHVADNVDHNLRTLDGYNTFHGMGIIASVTPRTEVRKIVPRESVTAQDIAAVGKINITFFRPKEGALSSLKFDRLSDFQTEDETANADLLWKTSWLLKPDRPSWNGYMQMVSQGSHPGASSVFFMPMIDLKSNDEVCIYSTMCFVCEQARRYNYTPVLTFDQPLWWKSLEIQLQCQDSGKGIKDIILRLGGLHTEMSFLGAIGHLMGGSGVQELLEVIYADTAVSHILTGKAISRAIRGHILIEAVLYAIILSKVCNIPLPFKDSDFNEAETAIHEEVADHQEVMEFCLSENITVAAQEIKKGFDQAADRSTLEYSVDEVLEQRAIESISDNATSEPENIAGPLIAESVISNLARGVVEIHEKQLAEDNISDENLELLPEFLEGLTANESPQIETDKTSCLPKADLDILEELFVKLTNGEIDLETVCSNGVFIRLQTMIDQMKEQLSRSRTARLWFMYLDMINILKQFIKAERIGSWSLHLKSMSRMLPFFAASGHSLYAKSAYIYLQSMESLPSTNPKVHKLFQEGYHVIRRSDRYWAGLSTDLIIEQMLMRSLKTSGGLTRGRGMTEAQRTIWLLSMPACAEISQAMEDFSGTSYRSSEQHKDSTKSRISRDNADMKALALFFESRNPFDGDPSLRNIASGVTADETVNVDTAKAVGEEILKSMEGKCVADFVFKKKAQAITLNCKTQLKMDGDVITVDPQLLFQRLISAARGNIAPEELEALFTFELATHPPSLFGIDTLIRPANKPQLAAAIWNQFSLSSADIQGDCKHVLDGGALLQRIPWPRGLTYESIYDLYVKYVTEKYGYSSVVVFDGYTESPSTKDTAHIRRGKGQIGNTINFASDMILDMKKDVFLSNTTNKQKFITNLRNQFSENGIKALQAEGDADLLIVETAIECAETDQTVLIGEDTDLLILLCHYASTEAHDIYFKSDQRRTAKTAAKVWSVKETKLKLGTELCNHIMFIHAILGCDTTSSVYGLGKGLALKKYLKDKEFRECAAVFCDSDSNAVDDIVKYGEKAMVLLFGKNIQENLDSIRLSVFYQKVAGSIKCVKPENLPPTSSATRYHSLRVFHQIQVWKGRKDLPAENWGWAVKGDKLLAVHTDKPPAPERLLKVVRCKCKADCKTLLCTCRKHGLTCSQMCGVCKGISCLNSIQMDNTDDSEDCG